MLVVRLTSLNVQGRIADVPKSLAANATRAPGDTPRVDPGVASGDAASHGLDGCLDAVVQVQLRQDAGNVLWMVFLLSESSCASS